MCDKETQLRALLEEIIGYQDNAFDTDDEIEGGDFLEAFAEWRLRALEALE